MKNITLLSALALPVMLQAQTEVTVVTGPSNADQVWYRLSDDEVHTAALSGWDLGFEISGFTASVIVNTAKGLVVYNTGEGVAAWDDVTSADVANWTPVHNSEISWSAGALNQSTDGGFNLGWGTYNVTTHITTGTELFVVQLTDGSTYKKLRIDALSGGTYYFTYADLDGSNEHEGSITKTDYTGKNFAYWNLITNEAVDREPLTAEWDLLCTRYMSNVMGTMYGVAGVLQNKTVEVAQLDEVDPTAVVAADAAGQYSADMNIIGSDWKTFTGMAYEYHDDRAYFVRAVDGAVWKLIFTHYGGGSTGTMTFTKELMSATDIADVAANGTAVVYPNPVSGTTVNMLLDVPSSNVMMEVYDLTGKRVMNSNVTGLSAMSVRTFDISALTPGAYVVRFAHEKGIATTRLIVE